MREATLRSRTGVFFISKTRSGERPSVARQANVGKGGVGLYRVRLCRDKRWSARGHQIGQWCSWTKMGRLISSRAAIGPSDGAKGSSKIEGLALFLC